MDKQKTAEEELRKLENTLKMMAEMRELTSLYYRLEQLRLQLAAKVSSKKKEIK